MKPFLLVLVGLNVAGLCVFQWGRSKYFRRTSEDKVRGGLGPLGTIFAVVQLPLVAVGGAKSGSLPIVATILLYACSLLLFFWAVRSHHKGRPRIAFAPGAPPVLITEGAYQLARHPFYLAYLLFWAGVAVIAPFLSGVPILVVMAILYYRAAIREEDSIMRSSLREEYQSYKAQVGMFFRWPRSA